MGKGEENRAFEEDVGTRKDESAPDKMAAASGGEQQNWDSPMEFLLSCISMSVGLGNVWRFPFTAYANGGGAFLIPYLIVLLFIGRPLYFLEMVLGQFSSKGSVKVWKCVPIAKGVGYGQMLATWCVVTYYCVLMALSVFYFFASFQDPLPWSICDPEWGATNNCYSSGDNISSLNITNTSVSSTEEYFLINVLNQSSNIDNGIGVPEWRLTLCLLFCWIVVFLTLFKGVASSGKVAYFTALFPYVVLITLLIRGVTLPGAGDGILFLITPQFDKIADPQVWYAAVTQCFFSLSVGFGPIITFASYNPFRHRIYRDSTIVSLADTFTSILAAVTVFSILGNLAYTSNREVKDVINSGGTGLAFISYPEAISKFDVVPQLFAVLFFLMLFTLAVGSAAGLTGCVTGVLCEAFPKIPRWAITGATCASGFLLGLVYVTPGGMYILDLVDYFGGGFIIYVMVITETIAIFWVYGLNRVMKDIRFMLNFGLSIYWKFTWTIFIPVALSAIFIYAMVQYKPLETTDGRPFPIGATAAGWVLAAIAILQIPIWGLHSISRQPGSTFSERFSNSLKPSSVWGPKDPKLHAEWKDFNETHPNRSICNLWIPKKCR